MKCSMAGSCRWTCWTPAPTNGSPNKRPSNKRRRHSLRGNQPPVLTNHECDRQSNAKNMDDHANDRGLKVERPGFVAEQWNHHAIHKKINRYAVECSAQDRSLHE